MRHFWPRILEPRVPPAYEPKLPPAMFARWALGWTAGRRVRSQREKRLVAEVQSLARELRQLALNDGDAEVVRRLCYELNEKVRQINAIPMRQLVWEHLRMREGRRRSADKQRRDPEKAERLWRRVSERMRTYSESWTRACAAVAPSEGMHPKTVRRFTKARRDAVRRDLASDA